MADDNPRRFAGRDGLDLAYRETGTGRPLVLLHGFAACAGQWLDHGPAAALAAQGYRVILPDLRGHGDSARPHDPARYPPDVLADDGLALIGRLGLDDYDLGGYSLGGRVALRMVVRGARPARLIVAGQGLTAVSSAAGGAGGGERGSAAGGGPRGSAAGGGPRGSAAGGGANRRVLTALARGDRIEPGSPDAQAAYWLTQLGGDPQALLQVLDSLVATPGEALRRVDTPALVVAGDQDHDHACAADLAAVLPRARFVSVPGDHWTALTSPELGTVISAFLGPGEDRQVCQPSR